MGYSVHPNSVRNYQKKLANKNQTEIGKVIKEAAEVYMPNYITYIILLKCSAVGMRFNGPETNCGIAHILGILLMNSYNTDISFSNYYNLQSVHFELYLRLIF